MSNLINKKVSFRDFKAQLFELHDNGDYSIGMITVKRYVENSSPMSIKGKTTFMRYDKSMFPLRSILKGSINNNTNKKHKLKLLPLVKPPKKKKKKDFNQGVSNNVKHYFICCIYIPL